MKSLIAKLFGHKKKKLPIDLNQCQSVLLKPIGTAVGDTIVHLAHLRQLKKTFPHIKIGVLVIFQSEKNGIFILIFSPLLPQKVLF